VAHPSLAGGVCVSAGDGVVGVPAGWGGGDLDCARHGEFSIDPGGDGESGG